MISIINVMKIVICFAGFVIIIIIIQQIRVNREAMCRAQLSNERRRIADCGKVVYAFANNCGYIARSCISREQLTNLIDSGIASSDLSAQIITSINSAEGITLGYQTFDGFQVDVKLLQENRERHVYIVGKSGSGKTNLMRTLIFQDLKNGNGCAAIAPEQEMIFEEILPYIPEDRIKDLILFNPADAECPSFNPLHLDEGEDIDIKADEVITIFKRVIGHTGPRMEELLRQALYALIGRAGMTLLDIEKLLDRTNPSFRNEIIRTSTDPQSIHFWRDVYPSFPKDAHLPITNRLGRFLRPKIIRNILCNTTKQSLNFRDAMDTGKVMLFNLSDGVLGEQNSQLLGQLIVSKFQLAVMSRARISRENRRLFYLYIDEFQTFTGTSATSYEKILSRARKYKLGLILAHQQTGQISTDLLKEIMGNVSTSICFLVSREDAVKFSKELVTQQNGEVVHIPEEEILRLKVGQAWCKIGQYSFLLRTNLADQNPSKQRLQYILDRIGQNYSGNGYEPITIEPIEPVAVEKIDSVPALINQEIPPVTAEETSTTTILEELDPTEIF